MVEEEGRTVTVTVHNYAHIQTGEHGWRIVVAAATHRAWVTDTTRHLVLLSAVSGSLIAQLSECGLIDFAVFAPSSTTGRRTGGGFKPAGIHTPR